MPYLQGLGRDHRKFGTRSECYPAVGASLLATLAHFSGGAWTEDLASEWTEAYTLWEATVVGRERRTLDITVLRIATWSH